MISGSYLSNIIQIVVVMVIIMTNSFVLAPRDTCEVINAPCSFGRVCLVSLSFCPRRVNFDSQKVTVSLRRECASVTPHSSPIFGTFTTGAKARD